MNSDRRDFLKKVSLLSTTAITLPMLNVEAKGAPRFNMSGYRAPKIDKVRMAIVGLGNRGYGAVDRFTYIEGAEIVALCDRHESKATRLQKLVTDRGLAQPKTYSGDEGWKQMLKDEKIDLLYICTPWDLHTPMSIAGMKAGAHVACEVPIALSVKDCWEVVKVSEQTKRHCMMLENCCYDFFEQQTLKMTREGVFGDIVHAEGAYIHDLLDLNFSKTYYDDFWRLKENIRFNGNLYPTHGIGPVAQCMNINRGDVMTSLVAVQSDDFHMGETSRELAKEDPDTYGQFVGKKYRGNMNTTMIRTKKGKSIMIQHDVTSPRPYSRIHMLSGTKGFAEKYPKIGISLKSHKNGHSFLPEEDLNKLRDDHTTDIVKFIGEHAKEVGGHGGMDFMMDWRLIDCLRNGLPLDQDVYDAAAWSAIVPLSVESVKNGKTVNFPDFTKGNWTTNDPVDITLNGGGNTKIRPKVDNKGNQLNV
jgi:predicted dehydrogenase